MKLRELQARFTASILLKNEDIDPLILKIISTSNPRDRLEVYRNNFRMGGIKVLSHTFPVCFSLVGERFFHHMAELYLIECRDNSYNYNDMGAQFPAFIAQFAPATNLPYLSHVVELEWEIHRVLLSEDLIHHEFDLTKLRSIPKNQYLSIKFRRKMPSQLLRAAFPSDTIWKMHRNEKEPPIIDLSGYDGTEKNAIYLMVHRYQGELKLDRLDPLEWDLLAGIEANLTLGEIIEQISLKENRYHYCIGKNLFENRSMNKPMDNNDNNSPIDILTEIPKRFASMAQRGYIQNL